MENFIFQPQTKIIFGKKTEQSVGREIRRHAGKTLLHYGGGSIKRSGLYDRVMTSLGEAGVEVIELAGVKPNPRLSLVRTGIDLCRKEQVGCILAVGGGSVIDSAKAIAFGTVSDKDAWEEFFIDQTPVTRAIPLGTILTLPAAGSEASMHTVVTDEAHERKLAAHGPAMLPQFSILNPELTLGLPDYQTACGASDMLAHIMERYFTNTPHVDFTDHLCEGAMRSILKNSLKVLAEPRNYDYRAEIMLAGMVAHNDSLGLGREEDWMTHNIEHELSAIWDVTHGEGLAVLFPAWIRYVHHANIPRFERFAEKVFDIDSGSPEEKIGKAITALHDWYRAIGLKTRLSELEHFAAQKIDIMATRCIPEGRRGGLMKLERQDIVKIFQLAL